MGQRRKHLDVVLITTKKGKEAVVDYNGYYGIQQPANMVELFDGPRGVG